MEFIDIACFDPNSGMLPAITQNSIFSGLKTKKYISHDSVSGDKNPHKYSSQTCNVTVSDVIILCSYYKLL